MDSPPAFDDSHCNILSTATHVTSWQQSDLDKKRRKVTAAIVDHNREETILKRLKRCTEETTQTLRDEISTQDTVLQSYKEDRAANQKRKADEHAVIAEGITNLVCQKTEYKTSRHRIDKEFASRETARGNRFNADTAK